MIRSRLKKKIQDKTVKPKSEALFPAFKIKKPQKINISSSETVTNNTLNASVSAAAAPNSSVSAAAAAAPNSTALSTPATRVATTTTPAVVSSAVKVESDDDGLDALDILMASGELPAPISVAATVSKPQDTIVVNSLADIPTDWSTFVKMTASAQMNPDIKLEVEHLKMRLSMERMQREIEMEAITTQLLESTQKLQKMLCASESRLEILAAEVVELSKKDKEQQLELERQAIREKEKEAEMEKNIQRLRARLKAKSDSRCELIQKLRQATETEKTARNRDLKAQQDLTELKNKLDRVIMEDNSKKENVSILNDELAKYKQSDKDQKTLIQQLQHEMQLLKANEAAVQTRANHNASEKERIEHDRKSLSDELGIAKENNLRTTAALQQQQIKLQQQYFFTKEYGPSVVFCLPPGCLTQFNNCTRNNQAYQQNQAFQSSQTNGNSASNKANLTL